MQVESEFQNMVALVTGSSMGIGQKIAEDLAERGATVVVCDLEEKLGRSVAETIKQKGGQATFVRLDVTDETEVKTVFNQITSQFGRLDILVNNAGLTRGTPFEEIEAAEWDAVLAVNLKGPFLCTKYAVPSMKSKRFGRIINMSSIAAIAGGGFVGTAHYAASKAGIIGLTKAAAKTYAPFGITVNAVAPGPIRTRMSQSWLETKEAEVVQTIPVRRVGEINDVVRGVLFLASSDAGFITGHTFLIDGGITIASSKSIV